MADHDKQHEQKAQAAAAAPAKAKAAPKAKADVTKGNDAYAKGARAAGERKAARSRRGGPPKREKDTREVVRGVWVGGRAYGKSDEDKDAIESLLTKEEVDRLIEKGVLAGDWKPSGTGDRPKARPRSVEGAGRDHLEKRIADLEAKLAKAGK